MTGVRRRTLGVLAIAGLAAALAGCASEQLREEQRQAREERINVYPGSYRTDLVAALHEYLSDPTNIHDAWVADPVLAKVGGQKRYAACVRFSARNEDGRYAGRVMLAVFSEGRFDQFIEAAALTDPTNQASVSTVIKGRCDAALYKRFPELEAMKR